MNRLIDKLVNQWLNRLRYLWMNINKTMKE